MNDLYIALINKKEKKNSWERKKINDWTKKQEGTGVYSDVLERLKEKRKEKKKKYGERGDHTRLDC